MIAGEEISKKISNLVWTWKNVLSINLDSYLYQPDKLISRKTTGVIYEVRNEEALESARRILRKRPVIALLTGDMVNINIRTKCLLMRIDEQEDAKEILEKADSLLRARMWKKEAVKRPVKKRFEL